MRFCLKLICGNLHFRSLTRLVPSNPPDDSKINMGNINMEEIIKNGLDGEKGLSRIKCCSSKIEKLTVLTRLALLQSTNVWVDHL